jgi:deoxyribose-phosphate aldolase
MKNPSPKKLFQLLDLTTLNPTDSSKDVKALADFAIAQSQRGFFAAAVCVHSNFAALIARKLEATEIKAAVVAGAFPHGQATIEIKAGEVETALYDGVDEIDIVINRGLLLNGQIKTLEKELLEMRDASGNIYLKTILETGELQTPARIKKAARLALECGADFIKTSTGKSQIGATPEAVRVMCEVIKEYHSETGEKRGIKVSGGVKTYDDAILYYNIINDVLGESWLNKELFRIGASSLAHELLKM